MLTRQLTVRHEVGSYAARRALIARATWQVARAAAFAFAGYAVVSIRAPRVMKACWDSRSEVTRIAVARLAYDAYPAWLGEHPDRTCPRSIMELRPYLNDQSPRAARDAWGLPLRIQCEGTPLRLVVGSAGEDGRWQTADDIWSDR